MCVAYATRPRSGPFSDCSSKAFLKACLKKSPDITLVSMETMVSVLSWFIYISFRFLTGNPYSTSKTLKPFPLPRHQHTFNVRDDVSTRIAQVFVRSKWTKWNQPYLTYMYYLYPANGRMSYYSSLANGRMSYYHSQASGRMSWRCKKIKWLEIC